MMTTTEIRNILERKKGQKIQIEKDITITKSSFNQKEIELQKVEDAIAIVQLVAKQTQSELEYKISELTTLALNSILGGEEHRLALNFVEKRGKTEPEFRFMEGDSPMDPKEDGGGGAIDIGAFGLRPTMWSLSRPKPRNLMIMDEPFSHLKGVEANRRALETVKEISKELGIQFIMVSDERVPRNRIMEFTDKAFETKKEKKISYVTEIQSEE